MGQLFLAIAIVGEVIATSSLRAAKGFTELWPSVAVVVGYGVTFYFFSLALQTIQIGVAYAIWSGVGIVLITIVAWVIYQEVPDLAALVGMGLILVGVLVINLLSKTATH